MNKRQQELFISFFEETHETEELIDRLKQDLSKLDGFNPHLLFDRISEGSDEIVPSQMRTYISQRMALNDRELYEIFEKFDWSRKGTISREDFIKELSPFGRSPLQPKNRTSGSYNSTIEAAFIAIFLQILKRFRIVDVSRKEIVFIKPYEAFKHLDPWKKGIIGMRELQKFYQENDFEIGQRQLFYLLHGLRRRCYRDVNLEVFCENLNPLQFGQYPNYSAQIQQENQRNFLRRSRNQEEAMKRSRIQNQKMQHEIQRAQRRKQAQIDRQLDLEERVNMELSDYERNQEEKIRRALLEEEQNIRQKVRLQNEISLQEQARNAAQEAAEVARLRQLELLRQREREIAANEGLIRNAYRQEAVELDLSRRRISYERQLALRQQLERDRQARRNMNRIRQMENSRRQLQFDLASERERVVRQIQAERLRNSRRDQQAHVKSFKRSRVEQLQKQLQATRAEMRERKSRLEAQSRVLGQLSSEVKSYKGPSPSWSSGYK